MDSNKVKAIVEELAPWNAKVLSTVLDKIWWHSGMINYLADFASPLHLVVHWDPLFRTDAQAQGLTHTSLEGLTLTSHSPYIHLKILVPLILSLS